MRAGRMRHQIELYRPASQTANPYGETQAEPERVASESPGGFWWCEVTPVGGVEFENGRQTQAAVTHQIRMRHHPLLNVTPGWRIEFKARRLEVTAVVNVEERNREVLITAREMVGAFPSV